MSAIVSPYQCRTWVANDHNDLVSVRSELRPDGEGDRPRTGGLSARNKGYLFERWLCEAFRLSGFAGAYPFSVALPGTGSDREQLDGLVFDGWQGFLIESKYQEPRAGNERAEPITVDPIYKLHLQVQHRVQGALGLFFSANGYTVPAVESAKLLRPIRVLLFDSIDLDFAIEEANWAAGGMRLVLRRKWEYAMRDGIPNAIVSEPVPGFDGRSRE